MQYAFIQENGVCTIFARNTQRGKTDVCVWSGDDWGGGVIRGGMGWIGRIDCQLDDVAYGQERAAFYLFAKFHMKQNIWILLWNYIISIIHLCVWPWIWFNIYMKTKDAFSN